MNIVSRGKDPSELKYRGKCDICKTTYSADGTDLKIESFTIGGEPFARLKCLSCDGETVYMHPKSTFGIIYDKLDELGLTTLVTVICYMITFVMSVSIALSVARIVSIISGGHK